MDGIQGKRSGQDKRRSYGWNTWEKVGWNTRRRFDGTEGEGLVKYNWRRKNGILVERIGWITGRVGRMEYREKVG